MQRRGPVIKNTRKDREDFNLSAVVLIRRGIRM